MENILENQNQDVNALVEQVVEGTATESEVGVALKTLRNSMSVNLIKSLSQSYESISVFNEVLQDAIVKFSDHYNESAEVLEMETLLKYIDVITSKQIALAELIRKTVQGRELFDSSTMSDDERKVLRLFKSFKSAEDKARFLHLVELELGS